MGYKTYGLVWFHFVVLDAHQVTTTNPSKTSAARAGLRDACRVLCGGGGGCCVRCCRERNEESEDRETHDC